MTRYQDIISVMSDGKPRTSRELALLLHPDVSEKDLYAETSRIGNILASKAKVWGEFEVVEEIAIPHCGGRRKVWRYVG